MTMDAVLHSFGYCVDFLHEQVAGVSAVDIVRQPNGIVNHPAWVIGHLTLTCEKLGGVIGIQSWLPNVFESRFGAGSVPVSDAKEYEPTEAALNMLRDAQRRIRNGVNQLGEDDLNRPFPESSYHDVFPTVRHALTQVLAGHAAYHIGQVSLWRRAMGLPGIGRSFE